MKEFVSTDSFKQPSAHSKEIVVRIDPSYILALIYIISDNALISDTGREQLITIRSDLKFHRSYDLP